MAVFQAQLEDLQSELTLREEENLALQKVATFVRLCVFSFMYELRLLPELFFLVVREKAITWLFKMPGRLVPIHRYLLVFLPILCLDTILNHHCTHDLHCLVAFVHESPLVSSFTCDILVFINVMHVCINYMPLFRPMLCQCPCSRRDYGRSCALLNAHKIRVRTPAIFATVSSWKFPAIIHHDLMSLSHPWTLNLVL